MLSDKDLFEFLEEKAEKYNNPEYISPDPISIPHQFSKKEDIEIAAFLSATISWGNRQSIIKNANKLMKLMDYSPHDFILNATENELISFKYFVHRTFNGEDCLYFISSLKNIYTKHNGLEEIFTGNTSKDDKNLKNAIIEFRKIFFETAPPGRTSKHLCNPIKDSACKRINMFLRWMVRQDKRGFDFGIWTRIRMNQLSIPLDVHTNNVGRKLGLLSRKSTDWKAVEEFTNNLRKFDPEDPVKYDFALFGLGIYEGF
jgi:uncharacterized protein (TIGR02757 family)